MSTKVIVGTMLLALVAIWVFGSSNDPASVVIVLAIAVFAYATARRGHAATRNPKQ